MAPRGLLLEFYKGAGGSLITLHKLVNKKRFSAFMENGELKEWWWATVNEVVWLDIIT